MQGRADQSLGRPARRLLGADRQRQRRGIPDLKGKRVGSLDWERPSAYLLLNVMAAYVGLDPAKDIETGSQPRMRFRAFAEGKIDAFLGWSAQPQAARDRKLGHVIVNTAIDRPGRSISAACSRALRTTSEQYPIATKRVLRAILKAADLCATESGSGGASSWSIIGLRQLRLRASDDPTDIRYDKWREYDPEDFRALLCAAHAGDRHDQVEPAGDHRQRARTGASSTS